MKWIISPFVGEGDRVIDKVENRPWGASTVAFLIILLVIAWAVI